MRFKQPILMGEEFSEGYALKAAERREILDKLVDFLRTFLDKVQHNKEINADEFEAFNLQTSSLGFITPAEVDHLRALLNAIDRELVKSTNQIKTRSEISLSEILFTFLDEPLTERFAKDSHVRSKVHMKTALEVKKETSDAKKLKLEMIDAIDQLIDPLEQHVADFESNNLLSDESFIIRREKLPQATELPRDMTYAVWESLPQIAQTYVDIRVTARERARSAALEGISNTGSPLHLRKESVAKKPEIKEPQSPSKTKCTLL